MNRTLFSLLLFCAQAAGAALNVRDFGAKGDGVSDDTKAIQAAFDKASVNGWYGGTEVFFPYGVYLVSDELDVKGIVVRGEGYATILQKNKDKDLFHPKNSWRLTITGLSFFGGRNQISLGNMNTDTGFLQVIDCRFKDSSGYAIETREGSNSSVVLVEKCNFFNCEQVFIHYTDEGVFRDAWISTGSMTNKAAIVARYGRLLIENLCGVPGVNGTDQRWIDFHGGQLTCRNIRFGGEAAGFTPIISWAKPAPNLLGHSIILDSCSICGLGNARRQCAIYCEEVPNLITIQNSKLAGVPALMVRPTIDLKTYFKGVRPGMLKYAVQNNIGEMQGELPELLKKPVISNLTPAQAGVMSSNETTKKLAAAVKAESARKAEPPPAKPLVYKDHTQQTDPSKYIEVRFGKKTWSLDDFMDATSERNSDYLAIAPAGDDTLLMRRKHGGWPHVLIKDIAVDLDKFPFLTVLQRRPATGEPVPDAIKVIDQETQNILFLAEAGDPLTYRSFNLRDVFKARGIRKFSIKYYFLGGSNPGDYLLLDFVRLEMAN